MSEFQSKSSSQTVSVETTQPPPINSQNFPPLLIYGGIAVAVIIALTYYNKVLLKAITKLLSTDRQR